MNFLKHPLVHFVLLVIVIAVLSGSWRSLAQAEITPSPTATETATASRVNATPTAITLCPTLTPTPSITPRAELPSQAPSSEGDSALTYIIQHGDTLNRIAERFEISLSDLIEANAIANPNLIIVGQTLIIPTPTPDPNVEATAIPTETAPFIVSTSNCWTVTPTTISTRIIYIAVSSAVLRSCPDAECEFITSYPFGTPLRAIRVLPNNWTEILMYDDSIAYIRTDLTSSTQPQATDIPTQVPPATEIVVINNPPTGSTRATAKPDPSDPVPQESEEPGDPNTDTPEPETNPTVLASYDCPTKVLTISLTEFEASALIDIELMFEGQTVFTIDNMLIAADGTASQTLDLTAYPAGDYTAEANVTAVSGAFTILVTCP